MFCFLKLVFSPLLCWKDEGLVREAATVMVRETIMCYMPYVHKRN